MKPVLLVQSSQQYAAKPKNSAGMQKMLFLTFSSQTANQAIPSGGTLVTCACILYKPERMFCMDKDML